MEDINVVVLLQNGTETPISSCINYIAKYNNLNDISSLIRAEMKKLPLGSWFFFQSSNELITVAKFIEVQSTTMRKYIEKVAKDKNQFNCIGTSTFFMNPRKNQKNHYFYVFDTKLNNETKVDNSSDKWANEIKGKRTPDSYEHKIKICKNVGEKLFLTTRTTKYGYHTLTDVDFVGKKVYPYFIMSIHFNPSKKYALSETGLLGIPNIQQVYGATIKLGYLETFFGKVSTDAWLF